MNELPKPVRARPVVSALPPPPKPLQQTNQQPTPKPVTIETLAYELREIRLFMCRAAIAKRRGGLLLIIFGVLSIGAGMLGHAMEFTRYEQASGLAALQGVSRPEQQYPVTPAIFMVAGSLLVLVGCAMQYSPDREP